MSDIKKRRFGLGDLIIISVVAIIVTSLILFTVSGTNKVKKITQAEFENYIYEIDDAGKITLKDTIYIDEIEFETAQEHSNVINVKGTFKEEYRKDLGYTSFTSKVTWESYELIKELSKLDKATYKITKLSTPVAFP